MQNRRGLVGIGHDEARSADADVGHGLEGSGKLGFRERFGAHDVPDVTEAREFRRQSRHHRHLAVFYAFERGDGVDQRRIGAAADHGLEAGGVAAHLDETRRGFIDAVLAHDESRKLIGQAAGTGRCEDLAGDIRKLAPLARRQHEAVVANRLPGMHGADAGAGIDRRQHVERADEADIGVAGKQDAHGVGIAGDMHVLDLEIAQPAFLLRHEIRQREGRDRSGEHHLDLAGMRCGRGDGEQRRGDANVHAKACDAKVWAECTRSNVRHDNSPPDRQAIGSEK